MASMYTPQQHDLVDATRKITRPWLLLFQQALSALGITQLIGDVEAGPGSGVQTATLSLTGVSTGTYGDAQNVAQFTVDAKGRLTFAQDVPITDVGITELTGDVLAGPGTGSQVATLAQQYVPMSTGAIPGEVLFIGGTVMLVKTGVL
ncbi:MAG TPA: hypothetical protein VHL34_24550 [Rhizomicrobium sp.]|jgi:hypothetical protein|nr:hypothetical protein [Rhizomicrobium sp.]